MFGINKNGTKHKIGIVMPAYYPASRITRESVSVTADGSKTWSTLLNSLFALIDSTKITDNTKLALEVSGIKYEYPLVRNANNTIFAFSGPVDYNVNGYYNHYYALKSTGSERWSIILTSSITRTDNSSSALTSGAVISVIY